MEAVDRLESKTAVVVVMVRYSNHLHLGEDDLPGTSCPDSDMNEVVAALALEDDSNSHYKVLVLSM